MFYLTGREAVFPTRSSSLNLVFFDFPGDPAALSQIRPKPIAHARTRNHQVRI
jgi:hypothetical protein